VDPLFVLFANGRLIEHMRSVHEQSNGTYGSPRMTLRNSGEVVTRKTVES